MANLGYNTELVTVHLKSENKMNYHSEHYADILSQTLPYSRNKIEEIAQENLKMIGERFNNDRT